MKRVDDHGAPLGDPVFHRRTYRALAILGLFMCAVAVTFGVLFDKIQNERAFSIRTTCEDTNSRHRNTIATLDSSLATIKKTASPARIARLQESRKFTVLLIDALAPLRDCDQVVKDLVSTG